MKKHPTLALPTKTQLDLTSNLTKACCLFKDLDALEHKILVFLSSTCHSSDLSKPHTASNNWIADMTLIDPKAVKKRMLSLLQKGYLREVGKSEYRIYIDGIERIFKGEVIKVKSSSRGRVENLRNVKKPVNNPRHTPASKATVTPITPDKVGETEKLKREHTQLARDYNKAFGTRYTYNVHGVWNNETNTTISFDKLRDQLDQHKREEAA